MKLALTKMDINEAFFDARVLLKARYTQLRMSFWIICGLTKGHMPRESLEVRICFPF